MKEALDNVGLSKKDIGFWCSGSSDYLAGRAFSFIAAVDAIGAFPPIHESHVEADAAWALYEAWVKIRTGEVDTALVYGFGKSSAGQLRRVLALQLDPYTVGPLWPDAVSIAGPPGPTRPRRRDLDRTGHGRGRRPQPGRQPERPDARAGHRRRAARHGRTSPIPCGSTTARPSPTAPPSSCSRRPSVPRISASGRRGSRSIQHRVESANLGARDLTTSPSTVAAAKATGADGVTLAELHAPFTHQEILLRQALGLGDEVVVNPSGGPLAGNPMFAAGLARIGEAATRLRPGERALAHATSGPALQQNLVCVLEAD